MRRLFIITLILVACNKSNHPAPTPNFTVSASINGIPTTFNAIINVDSASTPGALYIVAHSDSNNLTPLLEITISRTGALKPGAYPFADSANGPLGQVGYTAWLYGGAVQYPAVSDTVTVTAVNPASISGTFQGTCEYSIDSVVAVTNGQFTVGWNEH
jgi:hypothetical protein